MDTHSFIIRIKVYGICMELICQIRFVKYCFLLKKNDKGIGFTRDELGGKTMKGVQLFKDNCNAKKITRYTKFCDKRQIKFRDYKKYMDRK